MAQLDSLLAQAVKDGKIPHAVVFATNGDGSFTYKHAVGHEDFADPQTPVHEDAVFALASATKLFTSIAALQLVERGLATLDGDVAETLPELAAKPILRGYNADGQPVLEERKPISLRHLLTHSSGVSYDEAHPDLVRWQHEHGHPLSRGATPLERYDTPSVFAPGESWIYGAGLDWTGLLIERTTGLTLDAYMRAHLWTPLGLGAHTPTFWPDAATQRRVPARAQRTAAGGLERASAWFPNDESTVCFGGHGAYGSMADYLAVLRSLLADDGRLLRPDTVAQVFAPQLSEASREALAATRAGPYGAFFIGDNPPEFAADHGLAGILFMEEHPGRRKKGTLHWGGMANVYWLIDREADLALAFGTQLLPPGDQMVSDVIKEVELAIYQLAGVKF